MTNLPQATPEERDGLDRLLEQGRGDGELAALVERLRADKPVAPPAGLSQRVLEAVRRDRRGRAARPPIWAAAAAVLIAAAVGVVSLRGGKPAPGPLAQAGHPPPFAPVNEPLPPALPPDPAQQALSWIAASQESDGRWDSARWGGTPGRDTAATALATMALLRGGESAHQQAVEQGLAWLAGPGLSAALLRGGHEAAMTGCVLLEAAAAGREELVEPARLIAAAFVNRLKARAEPYAPVPGISGSGEGDVWIALFLRQAQERGLVPARIARPELARLCACDSSTLPATPARAYCRSALSSCLHPDQAAGALPALLASSTRDYLSCFFLAALSRGTTLQEEVRANLMTVMMPRQVSSGRLAGSFAPSGTGASAGGSVVSTSLAALSLLAAR